MMSSSDDSRSSKDSTKPGIFLGALQGDTAKASDNAGGGGGGWLSGISRRSRVWVGLGCLAIALLVGAGFARSIMFSVRVSPPKRNLWRSCKPKEMPLQCFGCWTGRFLSWGRPSCGWNRRVSTPRKWICPLTSRKNRFEVTLRERPGQLRAETRPPVPGAEWSVDGKPVAVGARLDIELEPGAHTLTVDSPRHQTEIGPDRNFHGKESDLVVDLVPVHFQLEVITTPPGATVSVNGWRRVRHRANGKSISARMKSR